MKNIFKMIAIAMMMATVFSCEKTETPEVEPEKDTTMTFTADFLATKTGFNEGKLTWEAGDKIAVCDGANVEVVTLKADDLKSEGASAEIKTTTLATDASEYYAIFPAACAYTVVDNNINNTFIKDGSIQIFIGTTDRDKSQTFKSYAVASEAGGHFLFKNVDAIVYFKTERTDIASVKFESNESGYVCGNVLINPSTEEITRLNYCAGRDISYKLNGDKEAYIPVRAGVNFEGGYTLTAYDSSNNVLGTIRTSTGLTFENGKYYTIKNFDARISGALSGKFTINSNGDQVCFSPGNLYWDGSSFKFETNQTDWSGSNWSEEGYYVSHFFWSKDPAIARSSVYSDEQKATNDSFFTEDSDFEVNGLKGIWRTLSSDEWQFIIGAEGADFRNKDKRFVEGSVNGTKGLLIFPDDFTWNTSTMGEEPEYNEIHLTGEVGDESADFSINSYDVNQFAALQNAGVVFLPSAGNYDRNQEIMPLSASDYGWYWSSSPVSQIEGKDDPQSYAYNFFFGNICNTSSLDTREHALCVRLVADCK